MIDSTHARWYCINSEGLATLCVDQKDATNVAAESDAAFPRFAPHAASRMVAIDNHTAEWQRGVVPGYELSDEQIEDRPDMWPEWVHLVVKKATTCGQTSKDAGAVPLPDHGRAFEYTGDTEVCAYAAALEYGDAREAAAQRSADFYRRRCELLQQWQDKMRDPERTIVCDILANGQTLPDPDGTRYGAREAAASVTWSAEDACEAFIASEVDAAPEALRRLGEWLNQRMDEDDAKTASRMVICAMMETSAAIRAVGETAWRADAVPLLDASFAAFDEITGLCSNLRQGGPAPEDLQSLSSTLELAIDIAANMMAKISKPPAEPAARAQVGEPDNIAVDRFAAAMKEKMAAARAKGRGGWEGPTCNAQRLSDMLRDHITNGDPRDVANFCMMLWNRGEVIEPSSTRENDNG